MTGELSGRISAVQLCRPRLAEDIAAILSDRDHQGIPQQDFTILPSRRNGLTLQVGGRYVHSGVAPAREAGQRIRQVLTSRHDGVVTVGMGLGYLHEALHDTPSAPGPSGVPVISVIFSTYLLTELLLRKSPDWWCTVGPDRLIPAWLPDVLPVVLREENVSDPAVVSLDAYVGHVPDVHNRVMSVLKNTAERNRVNRNTLRRFGKLWVRNSIRNIALGEHEGGIDYLRNIFPGVPTLVCGAGPTLDELRPLMPDLLERNLVIAVDTAVPVLTRWGLEPHFAVVSDPQYWNSRHLDRAGPTTAILVAEPSTHPRSIRLWQGPVVVSASLFPLGEFFDQYFHRTLKLGAGGSVATSAWDLARILGSRDIAMAGVDLGFPGNLTHCADSFFENLLRREANRLSPAEHGMARYLHGASPGLVPSVAGRTVLSDRRMDIYRAWFAEQARRFPDIRTVHLSPHSSAIEGVHLEVPADRISRLPRHGIQGPPLTSAGASHSGETNRKVLRDLLDTLNSIERTLLIGVETCRQLKDSPTPDMRFLDRIDSALGGSSSRNVVGFLAADALEAEMQHKPDTINESIEQSRRMYQALAESCRFHGELIRKFL
jgi:hypothetical protein